MLNLHYIFISLFFTVTHSNYGSNLSKTFCYVTQDSANNHDVSSLYRQLSYQ